MGCGCSGGQWQPPEKDEKTQPAAAGVKRPEPRPSTLVGPAAPGYFHGQDR